ncbi:MAG: macro domain-containing protein [Balneolaceae bacterium]|nr:macro domain-containing protein [Balneolaceae bacterium]
MNELELGDAKLELKQGDIANQSDMQAVVNAANAQLRIGGGVAGAIHRGAGPGLTEETRPLAPIAPGEAVITGAHNLPNDYVIHCLGPVYGRDKPEDELLANCYRNALQVAEEHGVERIAFPAISTGAFGYPMEPAARIALSTVASEAEHLSAVKLIRFVLFGDSAMQVHKEVMEEMFGK